MLKKDMRAKSKLIFVGLIVFLLALLAISCGDNKASTPEVSPTPVVKDISFVVHGKSSHTEDIKAPFALDRVEGTMTSNLDINFGVRDPERMIISAYVKVTEANFSFVTMLDGTYKFYFDNSQQEESRRVTLSYTMYPK